MEAKKIEADQVKKNLCTAVGKRIRYLRKEKSLTQEDLASKISELYDQTYNEASIGHIENGRNITIFTAKKIADALEVSLFKLFEEV